MREWALTSLGLIQWGGESVDRPFRQFAGPAYPTPATPEVQKTNPCGA